MASLSLKNICKLYPNGYKAVTDFNLEIADKEFIVYMCFKFNFAIIIPLEFF